MMVDFHLPKWASPLVSPVTYKSLSGGRDSTKTWTVAHLLIAEGYRHPIRVGCFREFQESIDESVKETLDLAIENLGLQDWYDSKKYRIDAPNGTSFIFRGLERSKASLKGLESINRVWVEQAERFSHASARLLIPTAIRNPGIQFYFTWNPEDRTDWVWQRFKEHPREGDIILHTTYRDNPWFTAEAEEERAAEQRDNPAEYQHTWEGEPNDNAGERKILPYPLLVKCVEAFRQYASQYTGGWIELGLDVADQGDNYNCLAARRGPILDHVERWRSLIIADTSRKADHYARDHGADRINYDAGGLGAGVRSDFAQMRQRRYAVRPELFGGAVKGPETMYSYRVKNKDFFSARNAQLGWNLRIRAEFTERLLAGEDVPLARCLFINPAIPNLNDVLNELSQPAWRENQTTGKTEVLKRDEDEPSPDYYDGSILAFASDSDNGVRRR